MRDKDFHALCAANALQALIAKYPSKGLVTGDDPYFAYIARGAITYADRMVEIRKLRRQPYKALFAWMSGWTTWMYASEQSIAETLSENASHD